MKTNQIDLSQLKMKGERGEFLSWIERKNEKWTLTDVGKKNGGKVQSDARFGEYVVWPDNISIPGNSEKPSTKLLNPTAIGKHFNASSQKINLILSELGFIVNDKRGWEITKLGKNFGGKQFKHEQSAKFYVLWPESILSETNLLRSLSDTPVQQGRRAMRHRL